MADEDLLLTKSEREELLKLRHEVAALAATNDILVQSIHTLSGDLLKRKNSWYIYNSNAQSPQLTKRLRMSDSLPSIGSISQSSLLNSPSRAEDVGLPNEIMFHLFKFMSREDLDNCRLVCRRWNKIIDKHETKLARRNIRLLKIVETGTNSGTIAISAATASRNLKFSFSTTPQQQLSNSDVIRKITSMLNYSRVRRCVMCGFELKGILAHDLVSIFRKANIKFCRLELIGLSLRYITPETFHRLIGEQIHADQYFIDGVRDADPEHFNSKLFEKPAIGAAEDITVYDVTSVNDDEVVLDVGDDVLLDFILGKNKTSTDRTTMYLDSPAVSQSFVYNALLRFAQEQDLSHCLPHSEFSHCRAQTVNANRCIRVEYDTEVQSEWSSVNQRTGSVLEAKVARAGEDDEFVHITLVIITPHPSRCR